MEVARLPIVSVAKDGARKYVSEGLSLVSVHCLTLEIHDVVGSTAEEKSLVWYIGVENSGSGAVSSHRL